jgi:tetratricopeptide (TPR) repeat protein
MVLLLGFVSSAGAEIRENKLGRPAPDALPTPSEAAEVLCAGMGDEDLDVCRQVCDNWPASGGCLFARYFGATFHKAKMLVQNQGIFPEEAARMAGMDTQKAEHFRLWMEMYDVVQVKALRDWQPTPEQQEAMARWEVLKSGNFAQGIGVVKEAIQLVEELLGPEHPYTAQSLNNLGTLYAYMGDFASARPLYERALAIREKVLGPEHPYTAQSLNNLGTLYAYMGDFASARPLYERALAILEKVLGPEHPYTAACLNSLGVRYAYMGDFASAWPLLERALAIREKVLGPEHPDTAESFNNLARVYLSIGDYTTARPLLERALAIREKVLGPKHPDTANSLDSLGLLYRAMGDYTTARPLLEHALAIMEKNPGPEHPDMAICLSNLAGLYQDMGDFASAWPLLDRALAIVEKNPGPEHPDTAACLNNLAMLYLSIGDYTTARPLLERALAIQEKNPGPEHPDTATALNNLAGLYQDMGDLASARPLLERALAILEKVLGSEHPDTATYLNSLAGLHWAAGRSEEAKPLLARGLHVSRDQFQRNLDALENDFQVEAALKQIRFVFEMHLSLFSSSGDESTAFEAALSWQGLGMMGAMAVKDFAIAEREAQGNPEVESKLADYRALSWERLRLVAAPTDTVEAARQRREAVEKLDAEREKLGAELAGLLPTFAKRREVLSPTFDSACATLRREGAVLVDYVAYDRFDPKVERDKRWTPSYLAFVVVPQGDSCRVERVEPAGWTGEAVDGAVSAYRQSVEAAERCWPGSDSERRCAGEFEELDERGKALRALIWDPVAAHLPGGRFVYMVADEKLGLISFDGLMEEDGRYLIETRELAYLPYPGSILRDRAKGDGAGALVLGDLDYDAVTASIPDELAQNNWRVCDGAGCVAWKLGKRPAALVAGLMGGGGSARSGSGACGYTERSWIDLKPTEALGVAAVLGRALGEGALLVMGDTALEGLVKHALSGRKVVHIVTHGFYSPEEGCKPKEGAGDTMMMGKLAFQGTSMGRATGQGPVIDPLSLSALVLSGGNRAKTIKNPNTDGLLTARDISGLDLRGTDLAVLSACQSGLGDRMAGDGPQGLGGALLLGGARYAVVSLWSVPTGWTQDLFADTYQRAYGGNDSQSQDTLAAFREARLARIKAARNHGMKHNAFVWAAFVPMTIGK